MSNHTASDLMLGNVNRPEYVSAPEGLLTALAWNLYELSEVAGSRKKVALVYRGSKREASTLDYFRTSPAPENMSAWGSALEAAGLTSETNQVKLAQAVSDAIAGVVVTGGKSRAATPMTPHLALLQNLRGMLGKGNPPDMGAILEQLFTLGAEEGDSSATTVSSSWLAATNQRMASDPLVRAIDRAAPSLLPASFSRRANSLVGSVDITNGNLLQTPFTWFRTSWLKLTDPLWVDALPPRVWVDWANTLLRLAVGCGFLWEALWFEGIARAVLLGERPSWNQLVDGIPNVLPWVPRQAATSVRNVAPLIGKRIRRAQLIRKHINEWLSFNSEPLGIEQALKLMSEDPRLVKQLRDDLISDTNAGKAVAEAVKYSLMTRELSGPFADHYGLLRPTASRSMYVIDPAPAWIAVIASLCCPSPGSSTTLGTVQKSLRELGLSPSRDDLVGLLERAGMARGSADADQGLIVKSAY